MMSIIACSQRHPGYLRVILHEIMDVKHGFRRLSNEAIVRFQKALSMVHIVGLPGVVSIEVTNHCEGNCRLCPIGQGRSRGHIGLMPLERFKNIIEQIKGYTRIVNLYKWGDPLLHPDIYEMILHVAGNDIRATISSTLRNWHKEDAEQLITSGLSNLVVSLHGLSERAYREYQPLKGRFDMTFSEALEKIRALIATKERLGREFPDIILQLAVTRKNEHEAKMLPEFAEKMGAGYLLSEASLNLRFTPFDDDMILREVDEVTLRKERIDCIEQWLPRDTRYTNPYYIFIRDNEGELPPVNEKWFDCISPWHEFFVNWDGTVGLCCGSFDKQYCVGNVFEQPLRTIWNNRYYHAARRSILGISRYGDPDVQCKYCPGRLM